jgi:hypothetical protein
VSGIRRRVSGIRQARVRHPVVDGIRFRRFLDTCRARNGTGRDVMGS